MKLELKSNFNSFMKRFRDIPQIIDLASRDALEDILARMCQEMRDEIAANKDIWLEDGSSMSMLGLGDDIEYEVLEKSGRIYVGRNTSLIKVGKDADQRLVNPYLFIEFGWGIEGEQSPVQYAQQNGWEYNVNKHDKAWYYYGVNRQIIRSTGRQGIDFFYRVIRKYRKEWKEVAEQILQKNLRAKGWDVE